MSSFLERQPGGYVTMSAFVLGIGLHSCASCFYLLHSKGNSAKNGWIWQLSVATLVSAFMFIVAQMAVLDFVTNPYDVPNYFLGLIDLLNYLLHFTSAVGITLVLIIRLTIFYDRRSYLLITMYSLAALMVGSKLIGDSLGMYISFGILTNEYLRYDEHPYFKLCGLILGGSTIADLIFSILGSLGFVFALSANNSKKTFIKDFLYKHHGYRLIVICVFHVCICIFSIFSVNNVLTAVTRVGMYLPSAVIAFELNTFLELSYVTAKAIMSDEKNASTEYKNNNPYHRTISNNSNY